MNGKVAGGVLVGVLVLLFALVLYASRTSGLLRGGLVIDDALDEVATPVSLVPVPVSDAPQGPTCTAGAQIGSLTPKYQSGTLVGWVCQFSSSELSCEADASGAWTGCSYRPSPATFPFPDPIPAGMLNNPPPEESLSPSDARDLSESLAE